MPQSQTNYYLPAAKAQTFEHDWSLCVVTRIKHVRAIALAGTDEFQIGEFIVPQATGLVELSGMRVGVHKTVLKIGFTDSSHRPAPGFSVRNNEAIGTLVLPSTCFAPILAFAHTATAHFRLGGNGTRNAVASDAAFFEGT